MTLTVHGDSPQLGGEPARTTSASGSVLLATSTKYLECGLADPAVDQGKY